MACAAVLAAVMLNPIFTWLTAFVLHVYPPAGNLVAMETAVTTILADAPGLWAIVLVLAVSPAIIEETAFRGFILSGFESLRSKWQAIFFTSILFGIAHSIIQQSIITFFVGFILGVIAVQTRSLIPCILFHGVHNSLAVLLSTAKSSVVNSSPILSKVLVTENGETYQYAVMPGILMGVVGIALLVWFVTLPSQTASEKRLDRQSVGLGHPVST